MIERDKEHLELQMQEHLNKKDDEKIGQLKKENEELKSEISRLKVNFYHFLKKNSFHILKLRNQCIYIYLNFL